MNKILPKQLKDNVLRNINTYFVILVLAFMTVNTIAVFRWDWLFISTAITVWMMFLGQMILLTPFSIAYSAYMFSYVSIMAISMIFGVAKYVQDSDAQLVIYSIIVTLLVVVPLIVHHFIKKRNIGVPKIPTFSIFFFALLITYCISQPVESGTYDMMFPMTVLVFIVTSVFGLNMAYRTEVLNRKLGIRDKNKYLRKTKEDLLAKYTDDDAQDDIDLIMYYLSFSLDSFIDGDFERSFMDAFKIIDEKGTVFKNICSCSLNDDKWDYYRQIRNNLVHPRIREKKEKEKTENKKQLKKLKELKRGLFQDNLDLLGIVNDDFIGVALKKVQPLD